jgi:hypothetical protein
VLLLSLLLYWEYEEGAARTSGRKKDPLKEYDEKEPMSPSKIKEHEPTAVKRDSSDQNIKEQQAQLIGCHNRSIGLAC